MHADAIAANPQKTTIATPETHYLITRCLNGRNLVCACCKEIIAIFVRDITDIIGNKKMAKSKGKALQYESQVNFEKCKESLSNENSSS